MAVIEVHELHKRYGETVALDGVSFDVQAGEVFGLLGPNGAGKTTAVEILEGLRTPDCRDRPGARPGSGAVRAGSCASGSASSCSRPQLQEKIRVGEALELYAGFYRNPRPVDELLDEWGLAAKRNTAFKKLSGGQQQRLFLALALLGRPELVFFDEITTGLDPAARRQTWDLVRRIRDSGVTVVLVSHLMDEVEELCDRVAILDRGRIVALDTPTALIASSGSEQRMRFRPVGAIPAGLIEDVPGVTAVTRSGSQAIVTGTGEFATGVAAPLGPGPGAGRRPAAGAAHARRRVRRADRPAVRGHRRHPSREGAGGGPMSVLESQRTRKQTTRALAAMTRTETTLFFREPLLPALVLLLPVLLVVGFGLIPGFGDPSPDLSGQSGTEYIASIGVAIVLAVLGLSILPTTLGTYRERGVLRRLRATPVTPGTLLGAQLLLVGGATIVATAAAGAGRLARLRSGGAAQPRRVRAGGRARRGARCSRSGCWSRRSHRPQRGRVRSG